jgi:hypothetical protein
MVEEWMAAKCCRLNAPPTPLPDLAPVDFFLFPNIKKQPAGTTLTQESFKTMWERAARWWYEWCKKCVPIIGNCGQKS